MEEMFFWSGTYQSVIINLCVPFHSEPSKILPSKRKTLMLKEKENILKEVDEKARTKGEICLGFQLPLISEFLYNELSLITNISLFPKQFVISEFTCMCADMLIAHSTSKGKTKEVIHN